MKYTKSELREAKNRIDDILYKLNDKLPYVRTKDGWNWMYHKLVGDNLEELNQVLAPLKTHIIDNDDYSLAVEMNDKVTPVWKEYCKRANRGEFDVRQDPYPDDVKIEDGFLTNEREIHSEAIPVQVTISDLRAWIKEQEPNPNQLNPTADTFFDAFRSIAHDCIVFIGFKYRTRKEKPQDKPGDIVGRLESYKKTVAISKLMKEIQSHIDSCQSTSETESYISSLLLPFKELCEVLRPPIMNEETRLFIDLLCYSAINHEKEKPGTIEYCLRSLMNDMDKYSFELYNVLIQNSIDLNEYQQKTGVYFRREWNPANSLFFKFGDLELIDSLSQEEEVEKQEDGHNKDAQQEEKEKPTFTRTINEYELGKYFNAAFKGSGKNQNYFELLVSDLKDLHTIKDCCVVAVMIWENKSSFIKPSRSFAKWCRCFFDCIDVKVTAKYNYSKKETPTRELKRKFYYL